MTKNDRATKTSNSSVIANGEGTTTTPSGLSLGDDDGNSEDNSVDDGIIAACVVVPLVALVLILVGGYFWYRRRYPVRMIIGRDVSKFTNPKYALPKREATLVRNDAERFFKQTDDDFEDSDNVTLEMNPVSARWGQYDNPGYQGDDGDHVGVVGGSKYDDDDDEEERKFRERKSWLFRRSEDKGINENMRGNAVDVESIGSGDSEVSEKKVLSESQTGKIKQNNHSADGNSITSDISELLNEQEITPRRPRRGLSKGTTTESSSTTESIVSAHSTAKDAEKNTSEPLTTGDTTKSDEDDKTDSTVPKSEENASGVKEESSVMKTAKVIFEQPSLEQVMAEVKARSRSLSVGTIRVELNSRQRSYSVDPSKSARKCSLHDETILAAYAKSVAARKILETPVSSASSYHSMDSSKQPLTAQSSLSASIVGEEIKVKVSSNASTVSGGSSLSIHSIDGSDTEDRHRGLSLASTNSNPHLITDLDNLSQHSEYETQTSKTKEENNLKTSEGLDMYDEAHGITNIKETEMPPDNTNIEELESVQTLEANENRDLEVCDTNELTSKQPIKIVEEQLDVETSSPSSSDAIPPETAALTPDIEAVVTEDSQADRLLYALGGNDTVGDTAILDNYLERENDEGTLSSSDSNSGKDNEALPGNRETEDIEPSTSESNRPVPVMTTLDEQENVSELETTNSAVSTDEVDGREEQLSDERHSTPILEDSVKIEEQGTEVEESLEGAAEEASDVIDTLQLQEMESDIGGQIEDMPTLPPKILNRQKAVEDDEKTSDAESIDGSSSDSSESGESGVKASYSFGGDDLSEKEDEQQEEEHSSDDEDDDDDEDEDGERDMVSAQPVDFVDKSKKMPEELSSIQQTARSTSPGTGSRESVSGASASALPGLSENPVKRVKILPLAVSLSDDEESDDDGQEENKFSDGDISDILGSSGDDDESEDTPNKDLSDKKDLPVASPSTYTFQHYDSDDDDIDV
ncbi:hypothetical protein ElyMa_006096700 [Elysia marginata]|uniref:Uncharacterized protein n=1 Tax=Elysia marginata TaxID=1093978 RepID=A0AAV4GS01_9GAST|nr:hypothetical protein ElyMa_006096700 [Elysia marginata]